jgi:GTP-binding protein HflX
MLSDTVGFISDLPTMLVASFRATLEEVVEADVIVHVRDISQEDTDAQQRDVETVLRQLDIDPMAGDRMIEVWNKIDRFDAEAREQLQNTAARRPPERQCILVSAETGEGVDRLLVAIEQRLAASKAVLHLLVDAADGAGISWLHRHTEVLDKHLENDHFALTVRVDEDRRATVLDRFALLPDDPAG